jgi:hypothetical protein
MFVVAYLRSQIYLHFCKRFVIALSFSLVFISFSFDKANSQQWVVKQYGYDSLPNITYGTAIDFAGQSVTLKMDIYKPVCNDTTFNQHWPLMVLVHGGAFLAGSKDDPSIQDLCKQFAKRGYVTASIGYRLGFIADDVAWNCNYPQYNCVFAADSAEWIRAYYRAVQDAKGAIRFLVNRYQQFSIDTTNVFVAGESAGGFIALGTALLDVSSERPTQTFALSTVPAPSSNTVSCSYAPSVPLFNPVSRPDLGSIEGSIEPIAFDFTIKAVGNFYGGMMSNLLTFSNPSKPKPAIYLFHQPCDLVVPIDSGRVYQGLSWCMTNGYGCSAIANTPKVFGSRAISNWNTSGILGYLVQPEYTTVNFPFSYLFGQASCIDQVNFPCHAYDNKVLREQNMAIFFSGLVTSSSICDTISGMGYPSLDAQLSVSPNPFTNELYVQLPYGEGFQYEIHDITGQLIQTATLSDESRFTLDSSGLTSGAFLISVKCRSGVIYRKMVLKQ